MPPDSTPDAATLDEIRRFEAQYARSPESLVFARLADAYRKAGKLERALEVVEAGLVRHQGYLSAHIVRGRTLRDLGRLEAATAAFHRVLDVDPQNLVALRALGEIARDRGRPDEARGWYERLAEVDPLDEQVRSTLESLDRPSGDRQAWDVPAEPRGREPDEAQAWEAPEVEPSESSGSTPELELQPEPASKPEPELASAPEFGVAADVESETAGSAAVPEGGWTAEAELESTAEAERGETAEAERAETASEPMETSPIPAEGMEVTTPEPAEGLDLATLTMAELYMRQGLYEEAERVYEQLLRFHPHDPTVRDKLERVRSLLRGPDAGGEPDAEDRTGEARAHGTPRGGPRLAAERAEGSPGGPTIRRYLHALLEGSGPVSEEVPRPSAFDAWLEREARR